MDPDGAANWIDERHPAVEKLRSALVPSAERCRRERCRRACYEEV